MKGIYTKPLLNVELFTTVQSVARDCSNAAIRDKMNGADPNQCFWDLGGGSKVFVLGAACNIDGENMGYGCYNNPSEGNYVFNS